MLKLRQIVPCLLVAIAACWANLAAAVTISIDYSLDDSGSKFFSTGNPQGAAAGAQAKAALESAAAFYSGILHDSLSAIQTKRFFGSLGGSVTWYLNAAFPKPSNPNITTSKLGLEVAADQYLVFVGAANLDPGKLGQGGPGGAGWQRISSGSFSPADSTAIDTMHDQFLTLIDTRGETSGFASWGGALSVDSDTNWHFNHLTAPPATKSDFYSVVLHELGHVLGFGASEEWTALTNGTGFIGAQAKAQYATGGAVPVATGNDAGHWSANVADSGMFGAAGSQRPLMVPALAPGVRRRLTNLDAASLVDVGWEITLPQSVPGDYNRNGIVDAADYTVWRDTLGSTSDLRANGNNSGASANKIDQADYAFWKSRFGQTSGSGSGGAAISAPEPTGFALLLAVGLYMAVFRRRKVGIGSRVT